MLRFKAMVAPSKTDLATAVLDRFRHSKSNDLIYASLFLLHEIENADVAMLDLNKLSKKQLEKEREHKKELSDLKSAELAISPRPP
jgi:hypothetical protein